MFKIGNKTKITLAITILTLLAAACASPAAAPPRPEAAPMEAAAPTSAPVMEAPAAGPASTPGIIPTFVVYPTPPFTTSEGAFVFGGCRADTLECPPESLIGGLGCERVVVRDITGGMTPPIPAAWCIIEHGQPPDTLLFQRIPGSFPAYRAYIVYRDEMYQLVNPADIQKIYAPIDSPEEALNYALLRTDFSPGFNFQFNPLTEYLASKIDETHVDKIPEGYRVRLFSERTELLNNCSVTTTSAVDVLIGQDGRVIPQSSTPVWLEKICP